MNGVNRVLFVDDEPGVLAGIRRMLRSRRDTWDLRFADSAEAALRVMADEPVDVIVSDFRMPGQDGGQLLAEVRRLHPDTARLILSGQTADTDMIRVVALAHQFLRKPCASEELTAAVERALRLRQELAGEQVRSELQGVETLPAPSSALHQLVETLGNPGAGPAEVAAVLDRDPVLAGQVLGLINSLFCTPRSPVTSLEVALSGFGLHPVRALGLWIEITRAFPLPDPTAREWLRLLHTHALETALLARRLAAPHARDDAFGAGLLHECGQLVFAVCRPDVFDAHLRLRQRDARLLVELERETFGVTHAQAGAHLLSRFGFPLGIIEATARHSGPRGAIASRGLSAPDAVRIAHDPVEAERVSLCGPGSQPIDDAFLDEAGVLGEVWSWRAEQVLRLGAAS